MSNYTYYQDESDDPITYRWDGETLELLTMAGNWYRSAFDTLDERFRACEAHGAHRVMTQIPESEVPQ